jgi:hypothetical protein
MKKKGLFGAALVMAFVVLFSCSSPAGSSGDPKDIFMNNVVAFVGTPQFGGSNSGQNPNIVRNASRSVLNRSADEVSGGLSPLSVDFQSETTWYKDSPSNTYAVLSIDYLGSARFVVYPIDGLKNHLTDLPDLLEDANVVDENDVDGIIDVDALKNLLKAAIAYDKEAGYIYAVVTTAFPYPDTYALDIRDTNILPSPDGVPELAYKTMPLISYYFLDSDNRMLEMAGAYDLIDSAGTIVSYKVAEYTPPDGSVDPSLLHNIPSDIDKNLEKIVNEGWTKDDKGTMTALQILSTYHERGTSALSQSVFLGGRAMKAYLKADGTCLYIERTTPYTYPDWGL